MVHDLCLLVVRGSITTVVLLIALQASGLLH
jgi:hypothetical protein